MAELFLQLMGETIIYGEKIWGGIKCLSTLSLSLLKKRIAVVKEKALAMDVDLFAKSKGQTQNFIFEPQIYSFLFRHFEKRFRKSRKSLENSAFCVVSCKTVISDKW